MSTEKTKGWKKTPEFVAPWKYAAEQGLAEPGYNLPVSLVFASSLRVAQPFSDGISPTTNRGVGSFI